MFGKKEYKCYRGKEVEECCNSRVEDAVARRTNVIILCISVALLIIALTVKTVSNDAFVAQVSFASTITSIILSVIAIWMSISGERSTNEMKNKVSDSVEKLVDVAKETKDLTDNLKEAISSQTYDVIKEQIESVVSEMQEMKTSVGEIINSYVNRNDSKENIEISDNGFSLFQNIIEGIIGEKQRIEIAQTTLVLFQKMEIDPTRKMADIITEIDLPESDKLVIWGIIVALSHNGFFADRTNYQKLKTYISEHSLENNVLFDK